MLAVAAFLTALAAIWYAHKALTECREAIQTIARAVANAIAAEQADKALDPYSPATYRAERAEVE